MKAATITAGLWIGTALAAVGVVLYFAPKIGRAATQAAGAVVDAVNPTSSTNLANRAANSVFSVAADVVRGDTIGTNVDTIGTATYGSVERFMSWLTGTPTPGQIATAPSLPKKRSIDLGEYADVIAMEDAELGALMNGFTPADTAPAYINYSAAFQRGRFP